MAVPCSVGLSVGMKHYEIYEQYVPPSAPLPREFAYWYSMLWHHHGLHDMLAAVKEYEGIWRNQINDVWTFSDDIFRWLEWFQAETLGDAGRSPLAAGCISCRCSRAEQGRCDNVMNILEDEEQRSEKWWNKIRQIRFLEKSVERESRTKCNDRRMWEYSI